MVARFDAVSKSVKWLDGAWDNKKVWCPHVPTWGLLLEANLLLKKALVTWSDWGLFGACIMIWHAGNCTLLVTPLAVRFFIFVLILWTLQPHFTLGSD